MSQSKPIEANEWSDLREYYSVEAAKRLSSHFDDAMRYAFMSMPPPIPLTRWQKIRRELTKKRSLGRWLTYKLMNHYDIYEGDY